MHATLSKIQALEAPGIRKDLQDFRVGDTVAVHYQIVEGDKLRVQIFRGVVIKRQRAGLRSTITVRKVSFSVASRAFSCCIRLAFSILTWFHAAGSSRPPLYLRIGR